MAFAISRFREVDGLATMGDRTLGTRYFGALSAIPLTEEHRSGVSKHYVCLEFTHRT